MMSDWKTRGDLYRFRDILIGSIDVIKGMCRCGCVSIWRWVGYMSGCVLGWDEWSGGECVNV